MTLTKPLNAPPSSVGILPVIKGLGDVSQTKRSATEGWLVSRGQWLVFDAAGVLFCLTGEITDAVKTPGACQ